MYQDVVKPVRRNNEVTDILEDIELSLVDELMSEISRAIQKNNKDFIKHYLGKHTKPINPPA